MKDCILKISAKPIAEIDQLVVEHTLFLQQMNRFGEWKKFKSTLHDVHTDLAEQGKINSDKIKRQSKSCLPVETIQESGCYCSFYCRYYSY